jgi:hypothetical protein
MGRRSSTVAAFMVIAVMEATNPAYAQNTSDPLTQFGGDKQRAARQAEAEWRRLPPAEMSCINQRLRHKGSSVEALVRRGVKPSAARLIELRSSCRDFVQGLQTDAAHWSAREATGSPTSAVAANSPAEPKDANASSLAESPKNSGMASAAEPPKDSSMTSSPASPKDSSVTLSSEESVGRGAEGQLQQGSGDRENSAPERGIVGWLGAALLLALAALAALLGIVVSLFIRWRNTGQRTAAVSLPEKNSEGAGDTPVKTTIAEASKVVTGESPATLMSQDSANFSDNGPTYGEIFRGIASIEASESNSAGNSAVEKWRSLLNFALRGRHRNRTFSG